jgi:dihydrofolate reductase
MNLIVAVDKNWAIGYQKNLLVRIPADQRNFRLVTTGKAIIMGRSTLESFPAGLPLKDRTNIVITHKKEYRVKDAIVVSGIEEAQVTVNGFKPEDVFVIGGASIYKQMLPLCDIAYITKIDYAYQADTWFPDMDGMDDWELTEESEEQTYHDLIYTFCRYERKNSDS